VRRKLHRPVVGGRRDGSGFRRQFRRRWRNGFRDRASGGRVLSSGGGVQLVLRASSGDGTTRTALRRLPLRSLRTAPNTPTRHHRPGTSFNPRQPNVSWKWRRRWRLQKAWCNSQRKQHRSDPKERQPSSRPPDPDTHPPLSPGPRIISPKLLRWRVGCPWSKHSSAAPAARFDQGHPPPKPTGIRSAIPRPRVG
jgi:hypothetical protein